MELHKSQCRGGGRPPASGRRLAAKSFASMPIYLMFSREGQLVAARIVHVSGRGGRSSKWEAESKSRMYCGGKVEDFGNAVRRLTYGKYLKKVIP